MRITIKLPINEKGKFKLQSRGNLKGRQFLTAAGLLGSLERALLRKELKEKTAIVVKEYIDSHFVNINETLPSTEARYLIYTTSCFLEDYLSEDTLKKEEKEWEKYKQK